MYWRPYAGLDTLNGGEKIDSAHHAMTQKRIAGNSISRVSTLTLYYIILTPTAQRRWEVRFYNQKRGALLIN